MDIMKLRTSFFLLLAAALALSCLPAHAQAGAVYTLTNSSSGNAVMVLNRSAAGRISPGGMFATGGMGTGSGLGSQGALAMDAANNFLFAVNAGSNDISVFRIQASGLSLITRVSSGGSNPTSLTVSRNVLYVLNDGGAVGGSDTIAGFAVHGDGTLQPIVSGLPLSGSSVGPAEIAFNTDGDLLVVTEKGTNNIDVFTVDNNGVASGPMVFASAGQTPYGFAFGKRDQVFVSDAFGGGPNAGAMTSYALARDGTLQVITDAAPDNQTAPCWVVLTSDGRFAYTTNTASGNVSAYSVGFNGTLQLLQGGISANTGPTSSPVDAAVSNDSRFLYVLTPGTHNVQAFAIALDGSLTPLSAALGGLVPASASGLVAR
jgi:6-phosphogluconolactonase